MVQFTPVPESLIRSGVPPVEDIENKALGLDDPIPTLPLAPSIERIGGLPTAVVVPIDQALTSAGMVEVADFW